MKIDCHSFLHTIHNLALENLMQEENKNDICKRLKENIEASRRELILNLGDEMHYGCVPIKYKCGCNESINCADKTEMTEKE